jgi:hypothetical protein
MISEQKFAKSFGSFWGSVTPLMDEYIHVLNEYHLQYAQPVTSSASGKLSALFAEMAFELFSDAIQNGQRTLPPFEPKDVTLRSKHRITDFLRKQQIAHEFTSENIEEISQLANNLLSYNRIYTAEPIQIRPVFRGCGIINECEGDIATIDQLVEVKAVKRNVSSADLRQVLVYLALRHAESASVYSFVAFINPRLGVVKRLASRVLAVEVSGMDLYSLLDEIVLYISEFSNMLIPEIDNDQRDF